MGLSQIALLVLFATATCMAVRTADMDFLHKQRKVYDLLMYVKQGGLTDAEFYDVGNKYDIASNVDMFDNKEVVQEFLYWYKQGSMLPKYAAFSPYKETHLDEMKLLFRLFYSAKDFQTFYRTACWARLHLNDAVFTCAFTVAVFQREDCKYMRLPPIYEVYPDLYYESRTIQEAHKIKMTQGLATTTSGIDNVQTYNIFANYSYEYVPFEGYSDYKLFYYTEDPALNAFYYYFKQVFPFWLESSYTKIPKDFRGIFYYFIHQQLYARYQLERISNGLKPVEDFDWYEDFKGAFRGSLMLPNGVMMPQRNYISNIPMNRYKYLKEIELLEYRFMNAIDAGFVYGKDGKMINIYTQEGFNILANLIEGNVDSCNRRFYGFYDALARDILGFKFDSERRTQFIPSALQCYSTSMRDPAFYRLYKRIMSYFFRYKKYAPYYTKSQLSFPSVKINSVETDKLITYMDQCETLINNAVYVNSFQEGKQMKIKAKRFCLNYKPYNYKITVNSDKDVKGIMRIFIGPAFGQDEMDLSYLQKYYSWFVEMDKFVVNLRPGVNTIERRSSDSTMTMPEMYSSDEFYQKLQKAISGSEPFTYSEKFFNFPERLTLPRGTKDGQKYKMFFYLSQFDESAVSEIELPMFGKILLDGKSFGYPLDRPMYPWKFLTSNMFFKDVMIYHDEEMMMKMY